MYNMALVQISTLLLQAAFQIGLIDAARPDYKYLPSTRAWYKFHTEWATWADARDRCQSEGAVLFHPENEDEARQATAGLSDSRNWEIHSGFSDLVNVRHYETVDGRPIEQVYHEWLKNRDFPEYGSRQGWRCGFLHFDPLGLFLWDCASTRAFICKAAADPELKDAQNYIANLTAKIADLEKELANRTAVLEAVERMAQDINIQNGNQLAVCKKLAANHTATLQGLERDVEAIKLYVTTQQQHPACGSGLDRVVEAITNHAASLGPQAVNQTAAIEQQTAIIGLIAANQTAASDRLMTNMAAAMTQLIAAIGQQAASQAVAMQQLTATIGLQAQNQTALMERLTLAMEKLASQEENSQ